MKIGRYKVRDQFFAYDGCHKIYLIEDQNDQNEAIELDYEILPISQLFDTYLESCSLRFISNWKLNKDYARQFKEANFRLD